MANVNYMLFLFARYLISWKRARAEYIGSVNARQPWNDVNVINITFREKRCIDEPAFQTIFVYVCKLQAFTCVNCADSVYTGDPLRSCPVWSVVSSAVCYSRRDHWSDKVTRKWSDTNLQAGVCLIVHNERSSIPFSDNSSCRLISIAVVLFAPERNYSIHFDLNGGNINREHHTFHTIHTFINFIQMTCIFVAIVIRSRRITFNIVIVSFNMYVRTYALLCASRDESSRQNKFTHARSKLLAHCREIFCIQDLPGFRRDITPHANCSQNFTPCRVRFCSRAVFRESLAHRVSGQADSSSIFVARQRRDCKLITTCRTLLFQGSKLLHKRVWGWAYLGRAYRRGRGAGTRYLMNVGEKRWCCIAVGEGSSFARTFPNLCV